MNALVENIAIVRRFEMPDLDRHAKWLLPRLGKAFPKLDERRAAGFLSSMVYNNEHMFLYQPHAVGLAQLVADTTLASGPMIYERFVWAEDPQNKDQIAAAANFYSHFARWGKHMSVEVMIVEELTDVPHEMVREKLGRVFNRQQQFVRL